MKMTLIGIGMALACAGTQQVAMAADEPDKVSSDAPRIERVVVRADAQFEFGRADIRQEDEAQILAELGRAGKVAWQSVDAVGYTDNVGQPSYNQALSKRRANAVKAMLVSKGVDESMITTTGMAAEDPVADNDTPEGRALNRRTAIQFQGVRTVQ